MVIPGKALNARDFRTHCIGAYACQCGGDGDIDLGGQYLNSFGGGACQHSLFGRGHQLVGEQRRVFQRRRAFVGVDLGRDGLALCLGHQRDRMQHVKAAHRAVGQVDAPAVSLGRSAGFCVKIGIRKRADADGDKAEPRFQHRQAAFLGDLHRRRFNDVIRLLGQHFFQRCTGHTARFGAQGFGVRQLAAHRRAEGIVRQQTVGNRIGHNAAELAAAQNCNLFHGVHSFSLAALIVPHGAQKENRDAAKRPGLFAFTALRRGAPRSGC